MKLFDGVPSQYNDSFTDISAIYDESDWKIGRKGVANFIEIYTMLPVLLQSWLR